MASAGILTHGEPLGYNDAVPEADGKRIRAVIRRLAKAYPEHPLKISRETPPFRSLVSTIMSSRTKDAVTVEATERLFSLVRNPGELLELAPSVIEQLIYPVGFYRTKARELREVARVLLERFGGEVPRTREKLMQLPGVGRKTANLVLAVAFGQPAICVDTHVHRISNRLGWVTTQRVEETEEALAKLLPRRYWASLNRLLVNHGQQVCHPTSPRCTRCMLHDLCPQIGVSRHR